jgi:methionyl-tRNA formyltransferase
MRIYFFTGAAPIGALAYDIATTRHPRHDWHKLVLETQAKRAAFEAERHAPDVILSFLNPYIVPARYLEAARGRAYNVHPSPPRYPGNDALHFAAYDGLFVAGATLHLMRPEVDCGEICDAWERPLDAAEGITRLRELSQHLSLGIFLENLPGMIEGSIGPNGRSWSLENKHSRADFLEKCRIDPAIDRTELQRRLRAFYHPAHHNKPFVEIHGQRFVYQPQPASGEEAESPPPPR